jgi:precorrin-6B methylase 2
MKSFLKRLFFGKPSTGIYTVKFFSPRGIKIYLNPQYEATMILGTNEIEIQRHFVGFSRECDYFFDIGSSNGYYGLLYKKYNPGGTVFSFDAQEGYVELQKQNFALNNWLANVHISDKFVSNFDSDTHISINNFFKKSGRKILLKIDIDGGEATLLNDIRELLEKNNCFLIVETHSKQLESECLHIMQDLGYTTKIVSQGWYRRFIPERRDASHHDQNRWFISSKAMATNV